MSQIKTKFITDNAVTNAKIAQMPTLTIKGNNTGGTANTLDLTVAQVNAILPVFTSTLNGLVPLSGGGTTNFLRADGSFAVPAGTGLTSINADATQAQTLTTGTTGTDFAIVNNGTGDHKFNIPSSSAANRGLLLAADWTTFNNKQPAGNYITALTGDATAAGPGSAALTLATVNGNVGSFGTATQVGTFTVNAKGLITAASNTSIQITEAQVTNLTTDLASKATITPTNHGVVISGSGNAMTATAAGSAGQVLQSGGASADPTYSTATYPSTVTAPAALVSNSNDVFTALAATTGNRLLRTNGSALSFAQAVLTTDVSGTLPVGNGGTGQTSLTVHGVLIGNSTSGINATSAGTAGQLLQSGGAGADPDYTVATFPSTTTANRILYSSATNTVGQITSANTSALVTNSSGVPAFTSGGTANRLLRTDGTTISFAQASLTTDVTGALPIGNGGTGQTTKAAGFDALSPMTTGGDLIYGGASGTGTRLANGSAGTVLTSNGGTAAPTWNAVTSTVTSFFNAYKTTNQTITAGTPAEILFQTVVTDVGGNFAAGSGRFTAPVTGYYTFTANISFTTGATVPTDVTVKFLKNNTTPNIGIWFEDTFVLTKTYTAVISKPIPLTSGDTFSVTVACSTQNITVNGTGGTSENSSFAGYLIGS